MQNKETQQLSRGYAEGALGRVELDVYLRRFVNVSSRSSVRVCPSRVLTMMSST
jgi:hypothetical protein